MSSVIIGAKRTLVALPSTEDLEESAWCSMAWTYQEALFPARPLIFTEQQVFYNCRKELQVELVDSLESDNLADDDVRSQGQSKISKLLSFSEQSFERDYP
jgi:hypothetical protein